MNRIILLLFISVGFSPFAQAQQDDLGEKRKGLLLSNTSAFALGTNEFEVNAVHSMAYGATAFDWSEAPFQRYPTEFQIHQSLLQLTYGLDQRWNFGVDVSQSLVTNPEGLYSNNSSWRIGPRIRWRPFGLIGKGFDLSLQHSALFSVSDGGGITKDPLIQNQLVVSQFFRLGNSQLGLVMQGTAEVNILPRLTGWEEAANRPLSLPANFLLGLMPTDNFVIFSSFNYNQVSGSIPWMEEEGYFLRSNAISVSAGAQYLLFGKHALFVAHTFLLEEQRAGGANAITFGVRMLFLEQY
ncbi:MAG: hypothetical protein AAFR61_19830 [Bacteroidota bacterium]